MNIKRTEEFCCRCGKVIDDLTMTKIKSINFLHVLIGKSEIPYIKILLDTILVNGLRNDNNTSLDVEAERNLCRSLSILVSNLDISP